MTPQNGKVLSSSTVSVAGSEPVTNKLAVLVATSLANFFSSFMSSGINIALPQIGNEFSLSAVFLGWMSTSYLLVSGVFMVPFGRLSDTVGIKKIFSIGMVIFTISSFFAMISTTGVMLLICMALKGVGAAMVFGNGSALITSVFPASERGRALGTNTGCVYLGLSLGPFLGGLLTQYFGWRSLYVMNIVASLIVILFIFWKIKGEWSKPKSGKFDLAGSAIFGVTIVCIMYGFSVLPSLPGVVLVLGGALGIVVFIRWENRVQNPVMEISLFKNNRVFTFSNIAALMNYSAVASTSFLISLYLQYIKGLSPDKAGLVIVAQPVMQAIVAPLAGRLSDKIEPRIVSSIGMALVSAGLLLMSFLDENTPIAQIIAFLVVLGLGFGLFSSPNANAIMSSVKLGYYGLAAATLATMRITGQVLSMGITLVLFGIFIGPVAITEPYHPLFLKSAKIGFTIFSLICIGGFFASLARGNVRVNGKIGGKE